MQSTKTRLTAMLCSAVCLCSVAATPAGEGLRAAVCAADAVQLTASEGWLEAAYCQWAPVSGATGYNVYLQGNGGSVRLDDTLIRQYSGYLRADAVGLAAGSYTLKVVPVINGAESAAASATTAPLTVTAHAREGYAFAGNGIGSGGYSDRGTPDTGAQILYITNETKDSVSLDVMTGSGKTTACKGLSAIFAARQKGYDTTPLILRFVGKIDKPSGLNSSGYLQVKACSNVTMEGIGEDAVLYGWGLLVRSAKDVEIRNLALMCFPDDGVSMDTDNQNIWVHHCDFFYGTAGSDADQAKGDGSCDTKKSTDITVSYNHFWDSGKAILCGLSESKAFYVTYHHNWFDHSDSRHPRVRTGTIHVYNNYYDGNAKYGIGATCGSSIFSESNYFRNCKYPMLISNQGTDVYGSNEGTFSGESGGIIKAYGNIIEGATRFVSQAEEPTQFDAYVVSSRSESVPSSVKTANGGTGYNQFDTASGFYSYQPHTAADVPAVVTKYAGRMNGGDFDWTFQPSDDTDYAINSGLMSAVKSYTSSIRAIGGNGGGFVEPNTTASSSSSGNSTTTTSSTSGQTGVASGYVHNFTENGTSSSFYAISGNLSDSKGSMQYAGKTLSTCLKMESATTISYTTTTSATLTLVLQGGTTIRVDGSAQAVPTSGVLTLPIAAGSHAIAKGDGSSFLYYMAVSPTGGSSADTTTAPPAGLPGDINLDGTVDISDAILGSRIVAEDVTVTFFPAGLRNGDWDGDGSLRSSDIVSILQRIARLI